MATENYSYDGGCTCGHLRYRMTSKPLFVHCCHCRWCQRQTGASFALNALIEADRVQLLQGTVEKVAMPSPSGKGQNIFRCPKCWVAVWSNYIVLAGGIGAAVHFVRVGTLDDPDRISPDMHIYASSKQPWLVLPPGTPAVDEYYSTKDTWPQESLDRRAVLLDAVSRGAKGL